MARLNFDHLLTYQLVVRRGSFSGAAEVLALSQPAVSQQIRQLEQSLNVKLLERTSRGLRPTLAGLTLLTHAEKIDKSVESALQAVSEHQDVITGKVLIGSGATACIHLMPALLQRLHQDFPALTVGVRTGNTQDVVREIEENRLDIGLVILPLVGRNLSVSPVLQDEFMVVTAQEVVATDFTPADSDLPLILFESGSGTRKLIDSWLKEHAPALTPIMELGSIEAIKRMVQAGLGFSIIPKMSLRTETDRQGLSVHSLNPPLTRELGIVMRQDRVLTRSLSTVLKQLQLTCGTK